MYGIKINGLPSRSEMTTEKSMSVLSYTEEVSYPNLLRLKASTGLRFYNFCALLVGP